MFFTQKHKKEEKARKLWQNTAIVFQNFEFLLYFWHKNLKHLFMPKAPQNIKILKNEKKSLF